MKNKNTVVSLLIVFSLICVYNLVWTFFQFRYEAQLNTAQEKSQVALSKAPAERSESDSADIKYYDDLLADETFQGRRKQAIANSFTLGLDLQGGMFVTMEIGVGDIIEQLAGAEEGDTLLSKAVANARKRQEAEQTNFVDLFYDEIKKLDPNVSLGAIFSDPDRNIGFNSTDGDVLTMLKEEASQAIDRSFNIIRTRIDQFGVASPNLQKQEGTGRILLELPGVKEPERVRELLRNTARLEFWTTHTIQDALPVVDKLNQELKILKGLVEDTTANETDVAEVAEGDSATAVAEGDEAPEGDEVAEGDEASEGDSTATEEEEVAEATEADSNATADADTGLGEPEEVLSDEEQREKFVAENPLFGILPYPDLNNIDPNSPVVGYALVKDTAQVNAYFRMEELQQYIPDDMRFYWTAKPSETNYLTLIAIKAIDGDNPSLDGERITNARINFDEKNKPYTLMSMDADGAREWARITEENIERSVAVVLDGLVYSFPVVQGKITGGQSQITGDFTVDEAKDLANLLKAGQLPVPVTIEGEDVVGPTLGQENVRSGMFAFIAAFILTIIFMAFYYNKAGLVANVALIANMLFILGCSAAFGIVLTLPGIAAVILTVGMAVDANVLIFERIREEQAKGRTLKASIKEGFNNAFSSVMDANVTTFLTGVVLYAFGIGPIRGFAVALMIGIVTSLISALIITRLIMDYYGNKGGESMTFGFPHTTGLFDQIKLQMVERHQTFYKVSGAVVLVSLLSMGIFGFKTGVDFEGGRQYTIKFDESGWDGLADADQKKIRQQLTEVFEGDEPVVRTLRSDYKLLITTSYKKDDRDATTEVSTKLKDGIKDAGYKDHNPMIESSSDVGPVIARDIQRAAFLAVFFSLIIIFLYILMRFRMWQYSLGAIVAIFHDVIIVLGLFSLLSVVDLGLNVEINQAMIAALLTIIGYSINDTVVVFDRIRENIGEMRSVKLPDIYNISIDQTISRTLITSFTTFLSALILFLFGGDVIRGFIFAIMIGVIVGTYSSIFVASPISLDLITRSEAARKAETEAKSKKKSKKKSTKKA